MATDELTEKLLSKLQDREDGFTERKSKGVAYEKICKTLVAFANSLIDGEEAFLFIGIHDMTGDIEGVDNTEKMQKWIKGLAEKTCYPPIINYISKVIEKDGKHVIAILMRPSKNGPHFAAPAFIRRGCESVEASPEVFEELIASRNDKARRILREKGKIVTLTIGGVPFSNRWDTSSHSYKVMNCDTFFVSLIDEKTGEEISYPLEEIYISRDADENQMRIIVKRSS